MGLPFPVLENPRQSATDWWALPNDSQKMWDSWQAPHRKKIPDAVEFCNSKALYEIGCGAGPNLRLLQESGLKLGGSDINRGHVQWANAHGLNVTPRTVPHAIGSVWDTVLSCYTLAYVDHQDVVDWLGEGTFKNLILLEPWGDGEVFQSSPRFCPRIYHPWQMYFEHTGWKVAARMPVEEINDLRTLVIAERDV